MTRSVGCLASIRDALIAILGNSAGNARFRHSLTLPTRRTLFDLFIVFLRLRFVPPPTPILIFLDGES